MYLLFLYCVCMMSTIVVWFVNCLSTISAICSCVVLYCVCELCFVRLFVWCVHDFSNRKWFVYDVYDLCMVCVLTFVLFFFVKLFVLFLYSVSMMSTICVWFVYASCNMFMVCVWFSYGFCIVFV